MAHEKECLENVREQLDSLKKERMMRMWLRAKCTECDKESVDDWEDTLEDGERVRIALDVVCSYFTVILF